MNEVTLRCPVCTFKAVSDKEAKDARIDAHHKLMEHIYDSTDLHHDSKVLTALLVASKMLDIHDLKVAQCEMKARYAKPKFE